MDNRYYKYNCPALMNDGRFLTSYVRSRVFDQYIRNINNIQSSQEYRHFLQNNGDQIINNLKGYLRETNTCKIEGKCLPMAGPNNNNIINYLKSNDRNSSIFFNQINEDNSIQDSNNMLFQNDTQPQQTFEDLSAQKAEEMAKKIYAKMVYEEQQNNISNMNNINADNS
jgi:hypothetical protein